MNPLIETNTWIEMDRGLCIKHCSNRAEAVNRQGMCERCYYDHPDQQCCVTGCNNIRHVAGEDACSFHELESALEAEADAIEACERVEDIHVDFGAQIALWTAYLALDETFTHPQLRRMA